MMNNALEQGFPNGNVGERLGCLWRTPQSLLCLPSLPTGIHSIGASLVDCHHMGFPFNFWTILALLRKLKGFKRKY